MFANVIVLFAVVSVIAFVVALPMSLMEWMDKNNRTFFFVKWYRVWSRNKGKRIVADAKKAVH